MNINYYEFPKQKNIFNDIFDIESVFNKFKIEDDIEGEYITLQNIKYAIFYLTKMKIKKKELIKIIIKIRKEIQKNEFLNKEWIDNKNKIVSHVEKDITKDKTNYSFNLIEKSEFFLLLEKLIQENSQNLKITDYDIILEFYYSLASDENFKNFHFKKIKDYNNKIENDIIDNNIKITFEIFLKKILEIFPNIEMSLIKSCFDRLDIDNIGFIKLSALEKFFLI